MLDEKLALEDMQREVVELRDSVEKSIHEIARLVLARCG